MRKRNSYLKHLGPVDPCPEEWILLESPKWTICQSLYEIYKLTTDPKAKILIRIAVTMAKKMSDRLTVLNDGYQDKEWTTDTKDVMAKYER